MRKDIGILPDSMRFYHEPDPFTIANLYYAPHAGIYHCDHQYNVERTEEACLDVCQALMVDKGEMTVQYRGQEIQAYADMLVLLDCREPHRYFAASDEISFRWFHIAGSSSQAYVNDMIRTHGFVIPAAKNADIAQRFAQVIADVREERPNPHLVSVHLHMLLAQLALLTSESVKSDLERAIQDSAAYIETHFADKEVSVPFLAHRAALSTCYYLRKFKEYQSATPHQYLQEVRLRAATKQLMTTSRSIEEIAETCGFCNTSHFIMSFRKSTGMTPLQFRIMWK